MEYRSGRTGGPHPGVDIFQDLSLKVKPYCGVKRSQGLHCTSLLLLASSFSSSSFFFFFFFFFFVTQAKGPARYEGPPDRGLHLEFPSTLPLPRPLLDNMLDRHKVLSVKFFSQWSEVSWLAESWVELSRVRGERYKCGIRNLWMIWCMRYGNNHRADDSRDSSVTYFQQHFWPVICVPKSIYTSLFALYRWL